MLLYIIIALTYVNVSSLVWKSTSYNGFIPIKTYENSLNGFELGDPDIKLNFPDKRRYDLAHKTQKMLELSKKRIMEENKKKN